MTKHYLAVDIGASSGRHVIAHMEGNVLVTEQIYRFDNKMEKRRGRLVWDIERLYEEVLEGMKRCAMAGKIPISMGIDTWGVDYVYIDEEGRPLDEVYAYRDPRTNDTDKELEKLISADELYEHTGIQKQKFNTIYQLFEDKKNRAEIYEKADKFLLIPDYLAFRLTGKISAEYTNATTTGMINAKKCDWDEELSERLGIRKTLFPRLINPGSRIGRLSAETVQKVGFDTEYVKVASHDTASAVAAVPTDKETIYISSGTWSLLGTEIHEPDCSNEAKKANFTNEGGIEHRYRFLKNIMGMWMIQSIRHEYNDEYDFQTISQMAEDYDNKLSDKHKITDVIDVNDSSFLMPDSMKRAIDEECEKQGIEVPNGIEGYAALIYRSLADCYKKAIDELEGITGKVYETIHVVGGGSKAQYLNRLIEKNTCKKVYAGPVEATAVGNIFLQMISDGTFKDINDVRKHVIVKE